MLQTNRYAVKKSTLKWHLKQNWTTVLELCLSSNLVQAHCLPPNSQHLSIHMWIRTDHDPSWEACLCKDFRIDFIPNRDDELEDMVDSGRDDCFLKEFERATKQKTKEVVSDQSDYINCDYVTVSAAVVKSLWSLEYVWCIQYQEAPWYVTYHSQNDTLLKEEQSRSTDQHQHRYPRGNGATISIIDRPGYNGDQRTNKICQNEKQGKADWYPNYEDKGGVEEKREVERMDRGVIHWLCLNLRKDCLNLRKDSLHLRKDSLNLRKEDRIFE